MRWFKTVLGALVTQIFTLAYKFFAYKVARNIAMFSVFIVVSTGLTLAMAYSIKALLIGARVLMPPFLANATYFLPSNLNLIFSLFVTIRLTHFIWRWSMKNFVKFTHQVFI